MDATRSDGTDEGRAVIGAEIAARRLHCSGSYTYKLFDAGELEGFRVGRKVLIFADSIDAYIERHRNGSRSEPFPVHVATGAAKRRPGPRRGAVRISPFLADLP